jgi:hypothetical protein
MEITLYTTSAPAHTGRLFVAPRPLPGRQVGRCHGMVFDVAPEFEAATLRLDGKLITVVTEEEYEQIVVAAVGADGYSREEYEDAGMEWDARDIGFELGLPLITITPNGA